MESGWLIERRDRGAVEYLHVDDGGMFGWTRDSLKALRLSRKADADALSSLIGDDAEYVVEHQWG